MRTNTNWLMFRDETTIREWESETGGMLARVLHFSDPFKISLSLPDEVKAVKAWNNNEDLKGAMKITHSGYPRFGIAVRCFLPFDGVFISRRDRKSSSKGDDEIHPMSIVWSSWLCEAPGARVVLPVSTKSREKGIKELRIGLPGGTFKRFILGETNRKNQQKERIGTGRFDVEMDSKYPGWLLNLIRENPKATWGDAYKLWDANKDENGYKLGQSDQDDLEHRILMTFPIWLKYRVCKVLLATLPDDLKKKIYEKKGEAQQRIFEEQILEALETVDKRCLGAKIVPLAIKRNDEDDGFVYVEPSNPVGLAARLTRVKRLQMSRHAMGEIPAEFRQNHPSFMGRLCPVESPESELVGLSLQLAQGAKINKDGYIVPADQETSETMGYRANLGWGAGLIPLFQHNDGTRNMMGAKNLRQVLAPATKSEFFPELSDRRAPAIKSGGESDLLKFTERLTRIGVCPNVADDKGEMALGRDLLVAYMPWYGWNMEDAIVIGRHIVDRHLFDVAVTKRMKKHIRPGWEKQRLAEKGETVRRGDIIARFVLSSKDNQPAITDDKQVFEIRYTDSTPSIVTEIHLGQKPEWMSRTLKYTLEKHIPLRLGDKLMGRHGNKGVIGRIEDTDAMPRLPDDERLPKKFRNRPIDIILNPHGVISRMNIGQLLETHLGWLAHAGGCNMADLMADGCHAAEIGIPKIGVIDHGKVQDQLEKTGLDRQGRIQLLLPDGSLTKSPVVVGFEHIVRLKHIPELKSQARGGDATCRYDSKTGQAVHGRIRGGGQRVGEMEVWALAGHQAECNLAEMLGGKADAVWALDWRSGSDLVATEREEGFPRLMKDWLFAICIDMIRDSDGKIQFSLNTDAEKMRQRMGGASHEVTSGGGIVKIPTASFACCESNSKGEECKWTFPLDRLPITYRTEAESGTLRFGDVLARLGYRIAGPRVNGHATVPLTPVLGAVNEYTVILERLQESTLEENSIGSVAPNPFEKLSQKMGPEQLSIVFDDYQAESDSLKCHIFPAMGKNSLSNWPSGVDKIFCFGRFPARQAEREMGLAKDGKNSNLCAKYLRDWIVSGKERVTICDFRVTCSKEATGPKAKDTNHASVPLSPVPPFGETLQAVENGLFDEQIFGPFKKLLVHASDEQWGYIELPVDVEFPLLAFLMDMDAWKRVNKDAKEGKRKEKIASFAKVHPSFVNPRLRVIPVLPSRYRLPLMDSECQVDDPIVADGYRPLLEACHAYLAEKEKGASLDHVEQRVNLAVEALFFLLVDRLKGKFGIVRRNGLGRRVDSSSRLVITPNPELEWNQAGIPPAILWELMGDKVEKWMRRIGKEDNTEQDAVPHKQIEQAEGWSWRRSAKAADSLEQVANHLRQYLNEHEDTLVLLNRQPSLHKDSFQAFHPVVLNPDDGEVFQLSPLCCKGFGADFDGDEMVGHYPVSDAAQKESAKMLPDNNLLSAATESSLAHFDQDFVMGSYWMSEFPDIFQRLKELLPDDCCHQQEFFTSQCARRGDNLGKKLLNHICEAHPERAIHVVSEWLRLSLEACSRMGVSFGFYDLLELTRKVEGRCKTAEHSNDSVQKVISEGLEELLCNADDTKAGLHVAGMAVSGARGKKQIRQLIGARGNLEPGALGYEMSEMDKKHTFWFNVPLTLGMDWNTTFYAAMNARSSMCDKKLGTGHAGALTRKLVFALWPFKIVMEDCGSDAHYRSVVTCKAHNGFCAKCYGTLPNGKWPEVGYPAGLIAAQSIGERGTQLSMQSFHTGTKAFDMQDVRDILSGKIAYFDGIESAGDFVRKFQSQDAYKGILKRHFELLWRVLFDNAKSLHCLGCAEKHSLDVVISKHDMITQLSYSKQAANILLAVLKDPEEEIGRSPIAEVLFNSFATRKSTEFTTTKRN